MRSITLATSALALMSAPGVAEAISAYRWQQRPLIVLADQDNHSDLDTQRGMVDADRDGFVERDMAVIWVVGDTVGASFGSVPGLAAKALRARYGTGNSGFRAVLVGKDGGVKLVSDRPITAATLFATIDAMPMRRDEMRRR